MTKRRGHGEGSIYQRKDGRWTASFFVEETGKRKYLYGETRKEVYNKLQKAQHDQKQGMLATGPQQRLKDYLEHWIEEVHRPSIRVSTYVKHRSHLNKHIFPALGHIQLQKLTPQQVQAFYTSKLQEGLSTSMVISLHSVLHKALDNAVRWNLVARNVCDMVSPPQRTQKEFMPLTKEQAQRLLEAAKGHRLEAMLTVALTTGMRRGELIGLRWQDINFEEGHLQIRRSVGYMARFGFIVAEPKTPKSRRKILLPLLVLDVLNRHRTQQTELRLKAGAAWQENGLVFSNAYGSYQEPSYLLRIFRKLLQDAGLPHIRFHDLRHSAATLLLTMGVNPKVVQELLGHSQIRMTMDIYSHVMPSMQKEAVDKLGDLFSE